LSPASIDPGSYALTEMGIARRRWPNPSGHVLPVKIEPTSMDGVPPYLKAVTVLEPEGNIEAEVLAHVRQFEKEQRSRRRRIYACIGAVALALAVALGALTRGGAGTCYLRAELRSNNRSNIPAGMMIDVTYAHATNTFLTPLDSAAAINVGPFKGGDQQWEVELRNPDGSRLGTAKLAGCVAAPQAVRIGDDYNLIISPR
jgi:hypothetical protein